MTTRRRRPTRTRRGLSLEQLDDWFLVLEPPARVEGVSMLDGYLTAIIIIGPRSIPPEEWFDDLFGKRGNIAVASGTMLAAITSIVGVDGPTASRARIGAVGNQNRSRP